ncbi:MAG TPA: NAD-dependent protein deacetylase [Marinobacterium sp.]|nr:NAD-dependent protein deacetylase [Marinobacterium sp.]
MQTFSEQHLQLGEQLAEFIQHHPRLFVLTGAGMSTDSGIPAYRDSAGQWRSPPPVLHQEYMKQLNVRQRYWGRSLAGWHTMRDAQPNPGHKVLAAMERAGLVEILVTQNVDRLHQKAGSERVVDLHGRADLVACMQCDFEITREEMHVWCRQLNPHFHAPKVAARPDGDADFEADFSQFQVPTCTECGGIMKARVVYYGDNVPKETVFKALNSLENSQAMLSVGSSLQVFSGFRFNRHAAQKSIPQAALTSGVTRADPLLQLKLDSSIAPVLEVCAEHLGLEWR